MSPRYYLERNVPQKPQQVISLGAYTGNTFFPAMSYAIFEILVKEADFEIQDDSGNVLTIEGFKEKINHTFTNNPPLISLNAG
jgi:hypothetical protein